MSDADLEFNLDAYHARLQDEAAAAEERSWDVAARPDAVPVEVPFAELREGDYITNDGVRWARVVEIRGPYCYARSKAHVQAITDDELEVTFEIPEAVTVSGERRWVIDRNVNEPVTIDQAARDFNDRPQQPGHGRDVAPVSWRREPPGYTGPGRAAPA